MSKETGSFACRECGASYARWQGKCSQCEGWNTLEPQFGYTKRSKQIGQTKAPRVLHEVEVENLVPIPTGIGEFDLVLGGGFIPGSSVLFGGEPGIGKSTLSLQAAIQVAVSGKRVLYVTGEETEGQIFLRAKRLGYINAPVYVLAETNLLGILAAIAHAKPDVIVLDSIQVMYHPDLPAIGGSVTQVRECTAALLKAIKVSHAALLLIGHITKDGSLAGPKVLEHMVDTVLLLEGERDEKFRTLRSHKNRYSTTDEIGLFEIQKQGLLESTTQESINRDTVHHPGSVISVLCSGNRGIMIEIQALVVDSGYGAGKRTFLGVDSNRAFLMVAAIEKILKIKLTHKDIILNIVNGLKCTDPSIDLAVVVSILSSSLDRSLQAIMGIIGEVGLTGEVRPVTNTDKRILELYKMGVKTCMIPSKSTLKVPLSSDLVLIKVRTLKEAAMKLGILPNGH